MGQILVQDVSEVVIEKLRRRAAARGRSVEAEVRAILEAAIGELADLPPQAAQRVRLALAGEITIDAFSEVEAKAFFANLGTSMLTPQEDERAYYASLSNSGDAPGLPEEEIYQATREE